MRPTLIAVAVVESDGQFLIGRRPEGVPLGGLWEFPGGKVEPDEMPEDAAVRECLEETGIDVEIIGEYSPHVEHYRHGAVHLRFFRCRPCESSQSPREPFQWVSRGSLGGYEFPAGNRELLRTLLSGDNAGIPRHSPK
jgi:8-oxo-dGTP diphosphatase